MPFGHIIAGPKPSLSFQGDPLVLHDSHLTATHSSRITFLAAFTLIASLLLSALAVASPASAAPVEAGYKDHAYGPEVGEPTEDKPQSKVWFNDGFWWGGLWDPTAGEYQIHKLVNQTWVTTGVTVDTRSRSHGDYLWDGTALYVASVSGDSQADPVLVFRFTYNASTDQYALDPNFTDVHPGETEPDPGVVAGTGPAETVTIAKDSTAQLWITYTNPAGAGTRNVMINRSTTAPHVWGTPFALAEAGSINDDDISAIVSFSGNVGVMWSDQTPVGTPAETSFYFAQHLDSNANDQDWVSEKMVLSGDDIAEDHINLKLVAAGGGRVLAAVKSASGPDSIILLDRNATTGDWTRHVVVGASQDATRPQVMVDQTNARAYVFYTSPVLDSDPGDQAIYYKSALLNNLGSFNPEGLGIPFISDPGVDINDISTSKLPVTSATGLVGIAASETNQTYYHGFLTLGGTTPTPSPTPSASPTPTPGGNREVIRVSGANRFATAAEISEVRFPSPGANFAEVFVATGANFPDALAAGPVANLTGAPILLVSQGSIPNETKAELTRLGPAKITIVGGTSQVSASVETQLGSYAASVVRLAGSNRYDTAGRVAGRFANNRPAVFIAAGTGFPDALSAGPAASLLNVPILLVEQGRLPNETKAALTRLTPATIYVVGGTGVVSDAVKTALVPYTDSKTAGAVVRLSGADRFATNVAVMKRFWTAKVAWSTVANGMTFPDALAEGAYELPLHLVTPTSVPTVVRNDVKRIDPNRIDVLGGTAVVSESVVEILKIRP